MDIEVDGTFYNSDEVVCLVWEKGVTSVCVHVNKERQFLLCDADAEVNENWIYTGFIFSVSNKYLKDMAEVVYSPVDATGKGFIM